jgi:hypothetical protein
MEYSVKRLLFVSFVISIGIGLFAQSVDSKGNLNHGFSIDLPAGRNGIQPSLGIIYNSDASNGYLGQGWDLNGLPSIKRDSTFPVNYNSNDRYIYNGQRLIQVGTGSNYIEFRTEIDSYSIIRLFNSNSADSYWEVKNRSGISSFFGYKTQNHESTGVDDGRLIGFGQSAKAYEWGLSLVEDLHGNYMYVVYEESGDNSGIYPSSIHYTINDKNPMLQYFSIRFLYDTERSDDYYFYTPHRYRYRKKLNTIEIYRNSVLYFQYDFNLI